MLCYTRNSLHCVWVAIVFKKQGRHGERQQGSNLWECGIEDTRPTRLFLNFIDQSKSVNVVKENLQTLCSGAPWCYNSTCLRADTGHEDLY